MELRGITDKRKENLTKKLAPIVGGIIVISIVIGVIIFVLKEVWGFFT